MQFLRSGRRRAWVAILLAFAAAALGGAEPPAVQTSELEGVWALDQTIGSQLSGPVTVREGPTPVAYLDGLAVPGTREGSGWRFAFLGGRGTLRSGGLTRANVTSALWIQPPTITGNTYATPVRLGEVAPGFLRGDVAPLPNRALMSMHVFRQADGQLGAFLRDPLTNIGMRFGTMAVALDSRAITFASKRRGSLVATLGEDGKSFALVVEGAGLPALQFDRRDDAQERTRDDAAYSEPIATGDGWPRGTADGEGVSSTALAQLSAYLAKAVPGDASSPDVHSVSIARHGKLVFDSYFHGFGEADPHDTRSAGKTYADVLAGIAIERGARFDDATPILALMSGYGTLANDDPRKRQITLGDALSMSTGLDCDDDDEHSTANEDNEQNQTQQPDWYRLVLDSRMVRAPGTKAVYCSASINLAGGAIAAATGSWLPMYFERYLAEPLQMQRYALNLTPTGQMYLGGGAQIRPRDFLKIGQVFLNGGSWKGRRILSAAWIARSWKPRLPLGPGDDYAYAWHVRAYVADGKTYRAYEAQGNGGQILDVIPQLDLAIMITQGNYNNFKTWGPMRDRIVGRILEATR